MEGDFEIRQPIYDDFNWDVVSSQFELFILFIIRLFWQITVVYAKQLSKQVNTYAAIFRNFINAVRLSPLERKMHTLPKLNDRVAI